MDKKSIIGLVLIGVVLFGFTWYNSSRQAEYNKQKAINDSIAAEHMLRSIEMSEEVKLNAADTVTHASAQQDITPEMQPEQVATTPLQDAMYGREEFFEVESNLMKLTFSTLGGKIASVELKDYKVDKKDPLVLFTPESSKFDLSFFVNQGFNSVQINTGRFYFVPQPVQTVTMPDGKAAQSVVLRLNVDSESYVDYVYFLYDDNYMIDYEVRFVNMESMLTPNQGDMNIAWGNTAPKTEKSYSMENQSTTIAYYYPGEKSIEQLKTGRDVRQESINTKVKWVGFKKQFFSSILVAENDFQNADVEYTTQSENTGNIKKFNARLAVPFSNNADTYKFQFYFGPNKFSILKQYDLRFERLVPLGGWLIGWINRLIVIPTFNVLSKYISSFGLIILILTILIKIIIAPLTYKSYLSSAKMRLLKPEIDELNAKYPKQEDAMKKQQATMDLYKKAGVNPMGGCIPLLIQFPILIAMFRFFPASIELRGESFLWADDLSSYDSILQLPFNIPFYGDHVSLFTLLMAVSVFISSLINYNQQASSAPQMAGMKFMMLYMMPAMLLVWFNNYSSGLSYYYLVSNLFTIGQTFAFRYGVSDEKLHRRMKENAKKAPKKKSKWQQRYDDLLKEQQKQQAAARKGKR